MWPLCGAPSPAVRLAKPIAWAHIKIQMGHDERPPLMWLFQLGRRCSHIRVVSLYSGNRVALHLEAISISWLQHPVRQSQWCATSSMAVPVMRNIQYGSPSDAQHPLWQSQWCATSIMADPVMLNTAINRTMAVFPLEWPLMRSYSFKLIRPIVAYREVVSQMGDYSI